MKTILQKLAPGVFACLALLIVIAWARADGASKPAPGPAAPLAPTPAAVAERAEPIATQFEPARPAERRTFAEPRRQTIVCGNCGAELQEPQTVLVAAPVATAQAYCSPVAGPEAYYGAIQPAGYYQPGYGPVYYGQALPPPARTNYPLSQWQAPASRFVAAPQGYFPQPSYGFRRY